MANPIGRLDSFTVTGQVKDMFFDRQKVIDGIRAEDRRRLSKIGAFVRQRARTDVLKSPSRLSKAAKQQRLPSAPGAPPKVWSTNTFSTLRNILFALNSDWESVIIGPRVVPSLKLKGGSAKTVPELQEKGGTSLIQEQFISGKWVPGFRIPGAPTRERLARYPARPFMGPALDKEVAAGTIPAMWKRGM